MSFIQNIVFKLKAVYEKEVLAMKQKQGWLQEGEAAY